MVVQSRTIRIRFLDQLSPGAQQRYADEQEKKREVTTDYTQYNKLRNGEATPDVAEVHPLNPAAVPQRGEAWQHEGNQEGRRVIDIHTKYEEQQLLIQSGAWTSSSLPESSRIVTTTSASVEGPTVGGGGGGYQNPVFNLEAGGEGVWHGEEVAGQRYE